MGDEIGFTEGERKIIPPLDDLQEKAIRDKAIAGIEEKQIKDRVKSEMLPEVAEVPKEIPFLFFHYGAKILSCPLFEADDAECKVIAKHMGILLGFKSSRLWSFIAILCIVAGKLIQCKEAVMKFFRREKKTEEKKTELILKAGQDIVP